MLYLFISCTLFKAKIDPQIDDAPPPVITKDYTEEGLDCKSIDVTGDQKANIKTCYQDGTRVVRKEMDINNDGKMDIVTHYDDDSQIEREDLDLDYDGIPEWVDYYEDDKRYQTDIDTNVDRLVDMRLFYKDEKVVRKQSDNDFDGKFDCTFHLNEDGEFVRGPDCKNSDEMPDVPYPDSTPWPDETNKPIETTESTTPEEPIEDDGDSETW